jgi:hypothetical protein
VVGAEGAELTPTTVYSAGRHSLREIVREWESVLKYMADFGREIALLWDLVHRCVVSIVGAMWQRGSCGASDPAAGEGTTNPADLDNDTGGNDEDDEAGENAAMIETDRMS